MLRDWMLRWHSLFRRTAVERELDAELRFHLERQADAYLARGMSRAEAERQARLDFGTLDQAKEAHRDARGVRLIDDVIRDVRYALRQFRRAPAFAVAAILCLALGIGVTTAISSVVNTVLLQPLPLAHADRLVCVHENEPPNQPDGRIVPRGIPYPDWVTWRTQTKTLTDAAAILYGGQVLASTPQGTAGLWGASTSRNAFTMLGVHPLLGRVYDETDTDAPIAVLSYGTWVRYFNADPHVVGTTMGMRPGAGGDPAPENVRTIIGVLPADFVPPNAAIGDGSGDSTDYYVPFPRSPNWPAAFRVTMIGVLAPDVSIKAASDELSAMAAATRPAWPANVPPLARPRIEMDPLKDLAVGAAKPALGVFLAAVVIVLLIACANVANLLLARGTARRREMALRQAIGASRGRLVRQILTECLILASAGGLGGAILGAAGVALAKQLATVNAPGIFKVMFGTTILPRAAEVHVDPGVLGIACALAAITSIVFGLLPALQLSRTQPLTVIGPGVRGGDPTSSRTRAILVIAQLALATMLLVGAGLLVRSFVQVMTAGKGYDATNVVALQLLFPDQYSVDRKAGTVQAVLTRLRQLPGVRAAGFARHGMLIGETLTIGRWAPPGRSVDDMPAGRDRPRLRAVSDGFLTAMSVPLIDGRDLAPDDDAAAPPVVVINRSAARYLFGTNRAVGQPATWYVGGVPVQMQVVGVVEDIRQQSLTDRTAPEMFVDYRQLLPILATRPQMARQANVLAIGFLSFAIRVDGDPAAAIPTIQRVIPGVDPNVAIDALVPMTTLVADSVARERFAAVLLGVFALAAAVLAAIGIYGVLAYLVVQRTAEIGVRMALGAPRRSVLALVLRTGVILTAIGLTLGMVGAATMTNLLRGMLFGITPFDPMTFAGVAVLFGLVTTIASYVPARRATRIDPLVALRHE